MDIDNQETVRITIGRRRGDVIILTKRAAVIHDTAQIAGGVELEPIEPNVRGEMMGVVLVKTGWSRQYFLRQRETWTDDNYFDRADYLMKKQGIVEP